MRKNKTVETLRPHIKQMQFVGGQMANVCFNLGQGQAIIDRAALARLSKQWDEAASQLREALAALDGEKAA